MAIKGHKERALLRRGYHIQEALQRRPILNETFLRRNLNETEEEEGQLNLFGICEKDRALNIQNSVYCQLVEILNSLPEDLRIETHNAIFIIYKFFRPEKKDNRVVFTKTIEAVLKNENPGNALRLIGKFLIDKDFKEDDVKKALINLRNLGEDVPEAELEEFLKKARFKEYSKYEESFAGENFELLRGISKLSHGQISPETGKSETFFKLVRSVYEGHTDLNLLINSIAEAVLKTDVEDLLYKSDLNVKKDLKVGDTVVIPAGSSIEVKKFDYEIDSYFSEYFSIYKNSSLPEIAHEEGFKNLYNQIIDGIFKIVKEKGQFMINKISNNVDGIMYDKNIIILKNDIEFYWSNKGQRGCDELRLSIRFRIRNSEITTYIYDSKTHSTQLTPQEISLNPKPKTFC